jgi:hypothetical protein
MCSTWMDHSDAEIGNGIGIDIDEVMASDEA